MNGFCGAVNLVFEWRADDCQTRKKFICDARHFEAEPTEETVIEPSEPSESEEEV